MSDVELHVPNYSRYFGKYDSPSTPIRIDEGPFMGTVYVYTDVKVDDEVEDDGTISYVISLVEGVVDGMTVEEFSKQQTDEFNESYTKPILIDLIKTSVDGAIEEYDRRKENESK